MASARTRRLGYVAAVAAVVASSACSSVIDGSPVSTGGRSSSVTDVGVRAVSPSDFPAGYSAIRLSRDQAGAALADLVGRSPGAAVAPVGCTPPDVSADPSTTVVVTGMSGGATAPGGQTSPGGTLTAVATRTDAPLADLADQIASCRQYTVDNGGVSSTVTTEIVPPSPVDSQQSLAYRRVVSSGRPPVQLRQNATVLAGQNDGIRVYAAFLSYTSDRPDGGALDALFTRALQRSRGR